MPSARVKRVFGQGVVGCVGHCAKQGCEGFDREVRGDPRGHQEMLLDGFRWCTILVLGVKHSRRGFAPGFLRVGVEEGLSLAGDAGVRRVAELLSEREDLSEEDRAHFAAIPSMSSPLSVNPDTVPKPST